MADQLPINSLRTSFRILEEIVANDGATLAELNSVLDRPRSTIYDHLITLHELKYIIKRDGRYYLSSDFLRMGDLTRQNNELYKAASEELERLAEETGEHVSLTVEEHGQAVIIATEEGNEAIPVSLHDGVFMYMHTAAPGKAILAFLNEERISDIIEEHGLVARTENTIVDQEELKEELQWVRENRYALDDEERLTGMRSVAVPVIDRNDQVRGSLTVYGPTNRINDEKFHEEFPKLLMQSGNIVEVLMNYD